MAFAKICYIPIGVDTYAAMTMENISDHCAFSGKINVDSQEYREIISILEKAEAGSIEDGMIRVKITLPDLRQIYIDDEGGIKWGADQKKINSKDFLRIKKMLSHIFERS